MSRSSENEVSIVRKKVLQVSSVMGCVLLMGYAQAAFAQDSSEPEESPAVTQPAPAAPAEVAPSPVTAPSETVSAKLPNSVAVLDLGVKQEYQDFFYDEKHNSKSSHSKKNRSGVDTPAVDEMGNPVQSAMSVNDGNDPAGNRQRSASSVDENSQSESSYSKQYGYKRRITYQEVKGLMVDIRTALRSAGYTVIQPQGKFAREMEIGNIPTIPERLAAGDFGGAQYVLVPNVVDASVREAREPIEGTTDFANKYEMNLTVEFTMVNTETQAVLASFNASGSGADVYLGKESVRQPPDVSRVKREMLTSFGADARKKLLEQLPKVESGVLLIKPGTTGTGSLADGDPSTLKVYKTSETTKEATKGGVTTSEKKKEEVRIYK